MTTNMFADWRDEDLARIGLKREGTALAIHIPTDANIHAMTVGRQLDRGHADAPAMIYERPDGSLERWTFGEIDAAATALAAHLRQLGVGRGDPVGLHTGMRPETGIAHMAVCKLGAVAVTLSQLYGPDAAGPCAEPLRRALPADHRGRLVGPARRGPVAVPGPVACPGLRDHGHRAGPARHPRRSAAGRFHAGLYRRRRRGAVDVYIGVDRHAQGHPPRPPGAGLLRPVDQPVLQPDDGDPDAVFWSPSDWAWVGGLLDMLFPGLDGRAGPWPPRSAGSGPNGRMDSWPATGSRTPSLPPPRSSGWRRPRSAGGKHDLALRVICTGGEALAGETLDWAEAGWAWSATSSTA